MTRQIPRIMTRPTATATIHPHILIPSRLLSNSPHAHYRQPAVPDSDVPIPLPRSKAPEIPPYPFGPRQVYKQSNAGLYGRQRIRFGNTVSEEHGRRSRRSWRPNLQGKRLWSAALGVFVRTRVTARVLRTIDKDGGLDNYLLGEKQARLRDLGPWGWRLRWRIMQTPAVKARFAAQRVALGLPPLEDGHEGVVLAEELAAQGETAEDVMARTDDMLETGEEFELGEQEEAQDDVCMKEEKSARK